MNGSNILIGSNREALKAKIIELLNDLNLKLNDINTFVLQTDEKQKSIGIDQIRNAQKFVVSKPKKNQYKAIVIMEGNKLTAQAQNALLKTLEEPPVYASVFILTKTESDLLETVISRCRKVFVGSNDNQESVYAQELYSLGVLSPGEKLIQADKLSKKDKDKILEFLEILIKVQRKDLINSKKKSAANNIKIINSTMESLQNTNVVTRLALENCFLKLK